jgi:hypothetical protein
MTTIAGWRKFLPLPTNLEHAGDIVEKGLIAIAAK